MNEYRSSPRLEGIQEAAKFTKLGIEVPYQPDWSDEEVDNFRGFEIKGRNTEIGRGQTKCWLGHLNVLHEIINQQWTTALIMEDDADWDIAIKEQMSLIAPLIREVTMTKDAGGSPYGDSWDLLWLGHCGDAFPAQIKTAFIDWTLPVSPLYRENDGKYTRFPTQLRMVYKSDGPICTYAYAVTAHAASRIYKLSAKGKDRLITTELREWCQGGVLRCITVNPELFHHHKQVGQVSSEIAVVEGTVQDATVDRAGL
ncbi:hypothetical protein VE03_01418 [Pseudogymnoascus sp. 23342-1-I1]|nr:hypothetical protein VE03_01418 [Pseudogymnoascus sp. 23342-1-I1]